MNPKYLFALFFALCIVVALIQSLGMTVFAPLTGVTAVGPSAGGSDFLSFIIWCAGALTFGLASGGLSLGRRREPEAA